ncbi:4-hydroxy-tetrahydrodipicolinate synthase [Sporomusa acidovorans]|uniref:4-hydroxy-tetrahydrodipicolinate synthase n=1 Tax=Sporomusa acidovorans (strain ATCC 49682 / DSM 3132 / Mol) TaxID=1123286 RepID=A0ABZ3IXW9_SPOA4|nr:4-hydroxy-tetrahydrodipicolinate synthase [Sporomusa acidovorans]OZC22347.1 4-hydroxy-tetrahydrodipicolinate synthase [Sporomusa acidovorans DSM 3132]SDE46360.1 4-hydroxy-tetrahydrodipicolinate synthase [Sporomusa acidovorans]
MFQIKGVVPPLITPLDAEEKLDIRALRNLIEYVIDGGVHGIFVLGSTGEFYGLDYADKVRVVETTLEQVNGRVPVYVGASAITTKECVKLTRMAKQSGADAVTVLTPMFINPTETELYDHFRTIAESADIPIILYNNPDRTGVNMSAGLIEKLADVPNIVGAKDTSGDMTLTAEYIRRTQGKGFSVMAGRDTMILATLVYGGTGCVAGTANVLPKLVVEIYDKYMAGDLQGSLDAQYRLALFRNAYSLGSFPVVPKDALNLMGVDVGHPIRPIQHMSDANKEKIKEILLKIGALT